MSIIATTKGGDFEKAPIGMQQGVCVFVHDIGLQRGEYLGKQNILHKIIVTWELAERMTSGEYAGQPFMVSKYYTLSLGEKANLRKDLESWRGKPFTSEELEGFDVERLVGANCFLNVTATENDKRKISAITPMPRGTPPIQVTMKTPSKNILDWIERERAKAVPPSHEVDSMQEPAIPDKEGDDLPF